jgi:DNA-binding transcriptional LysR family regulator
LSGADSTAVAHVQPRLTLNVNEAAITAAVAGLGILSTGYWGCRAELESGTLVRVLPEWELGNLEMYVVVAAGKAAPRAVRAVPDHLATSLRTMVQSEPPESNRARGERKQPRAR